MKNVVSLELLSKLGKWGEICSLRMQLAKEELDELECITYDHDEWKFWIYTKEKEILGPQWFAPMHSGPYIGKVYLHHDCEFPFKPGVVSLVGEEFNYCDSPPELPASRNITAAVRLLQDIRNGRVDPESFRNTSVKRG